VHLMIHSHQTLRIADSWHMLDLMHMAGYAQHHTHMQTERSVVLR